VVQREGVLAETGGLPTICHVAILAAQSEQTGVNGGFGMAAGAFCRRSLEMLPGVARGACQRSMLTRQREDNGVVEISKTTAAVMTAGARLPELFNVLCHKGRFGGLVTGDTIAISKRKVACAMAVCAGKGLSIKVGLVVLQRETGGSMIKERRIDISRDEALNTVAGGAIIREQPDVIVRRGVAGDAVGGSGSQCLQIVRAAVACRAIWTIVPAYKRESIWVFPYLKSSQGILPIVTGDTGDSKVILVGNHESGSFHQVTINTGSGPRWKLRLLVVTTGASQIHIVVVCLVAYQRKAGL
jgi:hypothetical protein